MKPAVLLVCRLPEALGSRLRERFDCHELAQLDSAGLEALAPRLRGGPPIVSRTVHAHGLMEGRIAEGLADIQRRWPEVDIGSYPYYRPAGGGGVAVVAKGTDPDQVRAAAHDIVAFMRAVGGHPVEGEPG